MRRNDDTLEKLVIRTKLREKDLDDDHQHSVDQISELAGTSVYDHIRLSENKEKLNQIIKNI